ncbi:hypothetical protein FOXB_11140 [Fusarium oxysporum f. sp. conglutinans Fo5176]|uniref:Uncharacterized protein n=1 Tax=Fusarium oxysporum (strain Fo5176) TaxID=660025 RepID=F9FXK8_FUSOF|nr:hypothetical protein FOXB_11140 [Fusarium oxysporum f. sp. conglutinans Fo5176]
MPTSLGLCATLAWSDAARVPRGTKIYRVYFGLGSLVLIIRKRGGSSSQQRHIKFHQGSMLKWTGPAAIAALRVEAVLRRVGDDRPMVSRRTSAHRSGGLCENGA